MTKVLILAYDFPPFISVGALRPYAWYKYFKEFGIAPVVVTRQWRIVHKNYLDYAVSGTSGDVICEHTEWGTLLKAPYRSTLRDRMLLKFGKEKFSTVRKMLTAFHEISEFISFRGPKSTIYKTARDFLRSNRVDAIVATGEPFVLFKYASALSAEFGIPWMADFRDLWSQSKSRGRSKNLIAWNRHLEARFTRNAESIITVSEFCKQKLSEVIGDKNILVVKNGYDPEISSFSAIAQKSDVLSIALAGSIQKHHPIHSFLNTCNQWREKNPESRLKIYFYGTNMENELKAYIDREDNFLKEMVHFEPRTPHKMLLKKMAEHNAFLLFNAYSTTGTKIYDYLALRRKIILCFSNDDDASELYKKYFPIDADEDVNNHLQQDMIEETNSGVIVENKDQLFSVFNGLHEEFTRNGMISCNSVGIEQFSRKKQIRVLANHLISKTI